MIIDMRTDEVVYITINDKVIYIDDSTGELIIDTWTLDGGNVDMFVEFDMDEELFNKINKQGNKPKLTVVKKNNKKKKEEEDE